MNHAFQIEFCTIKNSSLFSAVMKLRYEAYRVDDRLTWQHSWADMHDQWDTRSVIIAAILEGKPIGSVRVTVHTCKDELSYPMVPLAFDKPETSVIQNPAHYVEASRLCISPDWRGKGLWYFLAAHMIRVGHKSGRRYIVGSAIDELLPTWTKVGFCKTGHRYFNEDIGGRIHEMMILDIPQVLEGNCDKTFHQILANTPQLDAVEKKDVLTILCKPWH